MDITMVTKCCTAW